MIQRRADRRSFVRILTDDLLHVGILGGYPFTGDFGKTMKYPRIATISVCLMAMFASGCTLWDRTVKYFETDRAEKCPDATILLGASVLPAFAPGKDGDPTAVVYTARLTDTSLECLYRQKQNRARSDITLKLHAARASGGPKAVYRVPYFVALTTNGRILEKHEYWQEITFEEGAASADQTISLDSLNLKPKRGRSAAYYHYVAGFQLTQAQIAYNKTMGPYEP